MATVPMSKPEPQRESPGELRLRLSRVEAELRRTNDALERERADSDVLRAENAGLLDQLAEQEATLRDRSSSAERLAVAADLTQERLGDFEADSRHMDRIATEAILQARRATERAIKAEKAAGIVPDDETRRGDSSFTQAFTFPVTRLARELFGALPDRFDFDQAHEAFAEGQKKEVGGMLEELIREGCVRQVDERFVKTGHVPFF